MENKEQFLEKLDRLLICIYKQLPSIFTNNMADGLTLSQLLVIKQIAKGQETVGDISNKLNVSPAAVSKLVDQLVKMECVSRLPSQKDRRVIVLELTLKGRQILQTNTHMRHKILSDIFSCFTDQEINDLNHMIDKLLIKLIEEEKEF